MPKKLHALFRQLADNVCHLVPLFHAAGFYLFINMVLHYDRSVAFGVDRPISSDLMMQSLENLNVDSTVLPPSILEDMSHDEAAIKTLKKLKTVGFGGGMSTSAVNWPSYLTILQATLAPKQETDS